MKLNSPSSLTTFQVSVVTCGFPGGSAIKNLPANAGDAGSIRGSGKSPGEGNGNPLQYSCLRNPMDKGSWWATVHELQRAGHNLVSDNKHDLFFIDKFRIWNL